MANARILFASNGCLAIRLSRYTNAVPSAVHRPDRPAKIAYIVCIATEAAYGIFEGEYSQGLIAVFIA